MVMQRLIGRATPVPVPTPGQLPSVPGPRTQRQRERARRRQHLPEATGPTRQGMWRAWTAGQPTPRDRRRHEREAQRDPTADDVRRADIDRPPPPPGGNHHEPAGRNLTRVKPRAGRHLARRARRGRAPQSGPDLLRRGTRRPDLNQPGPIPERSQPGVCLGDPGEPADRDRDRAVVVPGHGEGG